MLKWYPRFDHKTLSCFLGALTVPHNARNLLLDSFHRILGTWYEFVNLPETTFQPTLSTITTASFTARGKILHYVRTVSQNAFTVCCDTASALYNALYHFEATQTFLCMSSRWSLDHAQTSVSPDTIWSRTITVLSRRTQNTVECKQWNWKHFFVAHSGTWVLSQILAPTLHMDIYMRLQILHAPYRTPRAYKLTRSQCTMHTRLSRHCPGIVQCIPSRLGRCKGILQCIQSILRRCKGPSLCGARLDRTRVRPNFSI